MTTIKTVAKPAKAAGKKVPAKSSVSKPQVKKATPAAKAAPVAGAKSAAKRTAPISARGMSKPAAGEPKSAARKPKKEQKVKVVRDSFTMPQNEYQKIAEIKDICMKAGLPVKKSEVLRAGLKAPAEMKAPQLKRAMAELEKIKTGRPKKQ